MILGTPTEYLEEQNILFSEFVGLHEPMEFQADNFLTRSRLEWLDICVVTSSLEEIERKF